MFSTPRRNQLSNAATTTLSDADQNLPAKWASLAQPLPLLLQAFKDVTTKDYDFWHRAIPYFRRNAIPQGTVLYHRGDSPDAFYVLQDGVLRADHELDQGRYVESIVAGTTCGELPFFAESRRTGTVVAETECVAWMMDKESWERLEKEQADVATEMLKVGLKLTSERMDSITSYVLVMAS
jgi:SulP family sulfate permease